MNMKRNDVVDFMKGAGICLVVLGHLSPDAHIVRFIYSFHMFLFFVLSGYFAERYKTKKLKECIKTNAVRLLFPYICYGLLSQAVDIILGNIGFKTAVDNILFLNGDVGWNSPLWFLVCLFWSNILMYVIVRCSDILQVILWVVLMMSWYYFGITKMMLPFGLHIVPVVTLFEMLGYWGKRCNLADTVKKFVHNKKYGYVYLCACMAAAFMLTVVAGVVNNTLVSVYRVEYDSYPETFVAAVSGIIFVWSVSVLCVELSAEYKICSGIKRLMILYGQNTMIIMCTQYFAFAVIKYVSLYFAHIDLWGYTGTLKALIVSLVVLAAYYLLIAGKLFARKLGCFRLLFSVDV